MTQGPSLRSQRTPESTRTMGMTCRPVAALPALDAKSHLARSFPVHQTVSDCCCKEKLTTFDLDTFNRDTFDLERSTVNRQLTILNGPNLNLLGEREPGVYGRTSLPQIEDDLRAAFPDVAFSFFQANGAGALIDRLHRAHADEAGGVVINPGGLSHTSVALRDAVAAVVPPVVEVHLSNVHAREDFRRELVTAGACEGVIAGLGPRGYLLAVRYLMEHASTGA